MIPFPERFPINFTDSSGDYHDLLSPNDHRVLTSIQYATSDDAEVALNLAVEGQRKLEQLPAFERSAILRKVSAMLAENASKLAWLIATEGGKPLRDAVVEVARAQTTLDLCAEEALRIGGEAIPMERNKFGLNHLSLTTRDPIGPVLAISAFNHPLNLLAHQVGCALAAGCAVIVKPAPATPLCAYKLQKFFFEARLPKEALTVVNADVPQIEQLASSPKIAYVTFIGSAKVGWNLRKIIAPGTRLNLEHGGLAPALVREDADVDAAVSALVKGAFYHSGQVCISTQRVYVHETVYQEFRQKFLAATEALVMGDATHEQTDVGPLIRSAEVTRIQDWISDAVSRGARVLCGNTVEGKGQYLRPTILDNVSADARLMLDEVFGPVVCLNSYRDEKAVIDHLNSGEYLFQACMFTSNIQHALRLAKQVKTMTIAINEHNAYRVDWTPFGGHRRSGLGMSGVKYLIEEMTQLKQIIFKY